VLVCLLIRAARGRGAIAAAACGLLWVFTALTVNSVRNCLAGHYPNLFGGNLLRRFSGPELALALIVAAVLSLLVVKSFLPSPVAIVRHALIAMSVCGIVNVGLAVYKIRTSHFPPVAPVRASFLPTQPGTTPRVVWLVFDELDFRRRSSIASRVSLFQFSMTLDKQPFSRRMPILHPAQHPIRC
jgi:hypothetical protein